MISPYKNESATERLAFYSWSDGNTSATHSVIVNHPYDLHASFENQFLVNLRGIDEYGAPVNVSTFYVTNSSPGKQIYLYANQGYTVKSALYKGTNVTVEQAISSNSSRDIAVYLPLYDVHVSASDVFGTPLEVPVTVTLANGTEKSLVTSQNGTAYATMVQDVPYGKAVASTRYLGLQLSSSVQYGQNVRFTVVSLFDLEVFAAVVLIAFAIYFIASRHVLKTPVQAYTRRPGRGNQ